MSFENMSAENRMAFNLHRCCSFCRRTGHRITNCDDERLHEFERRCINFINDNQLNELYFRDFLLEQASNDPHLIKAFAIKKCNLSTRSQIDVCIESIVNCFRSRFVENQQSNISTETVTPTQTLSSQILPNSFLGRLFHLLYINNNDSTYINEYLLFALILNELQHEIQDEDFEIIFNNKKFKINTELIDCEENLEEICECNICYESYEKVNFIKLNCKHEFCKVCVKKSLQNETKTSLSCALCRNNITDFEIRDLSIKDELKDFIDNDFI